MKLNGFIKEWNVAYQGNKSIDEVIADLSNDIYETLELKTDLEMIFFDLSKAYDTVWIDGLLYKLKYYYKINGTFWCLIKSFLTNRFNRVVIGDYVTKWKKHSYGIPQGGPLSPLTFIIYINDFFASCKFIKFRMYADDTSAWQKPDIVKYRQNYLEYNVKENEIKKEIKHNLLQIECNNYVKWCNLWKLCLNYDKCESMYFSNKKNTKAVEFEINNNKLKVVAKKAHMPENSDLREWKGHHVRFLGNFFNCAGSFNEMINIIVNKNNSNLAMVMRTAAIYKLNSIAIWRLGRPIIFSLIEFGMKFYTAESKVRIKKVFDFQFKLARYALVARESTNREKLEMILYFESMELIIKKRLVEFEEQAVVAPKTSLKSSIMQQFLDFKNEHECNNREKSRLNPKLKLKKFEELHSMRRSVLMRARKIRINYGMNKIERMENNYYSEEKKPVPCYIEPYPQELEIMEDFGDAVNIFRNNNSSIWWTDGSCSEYLGGYGAVTLQKRSCGRLTSLYGYVNHWTEINYCEFCGIELVLKECRSDEEIYNSNNIENIVIFTDSMSVIKLMKPNGYPDSEQYYNVMIRIFKKINLLNNYNKKVILVKVAAHVGHTGNELADWWARYGYYVACKQNEEFGDWDENIMPLNVRNEINNKWLEREYYEERDRNRKNRIKVREEKGKNGVKSKLMSKLKKTKHLINEMSFLSRSETGVITRLRTEHIDLNVYNSVIYAKGTKTEMNCEECGRYETVRHYLLDCNKYEKERDVFINELKDISVEFEKETNVNVMRILFNYKYQKKPYERDNIEIRVAILRAVCRYVAKTRRFINERIKTKIFVNLEKKYNNSDKEDYNSDDEERCEEILNKELNSISLLNEKFGSDEIQFQSYV